MVMFSSFSVSVLPALQCFVLCTLLDWLWVRYCMIGEASSVENDSNLLDLSIVLNVLMTKSKSQLLISLNGSMYSST